MSHFRLRGRGRSQLVVAALGIFGIACGADTFDDVYPVPDDLYAASAVGSSHLWAAGYFGAIYRTRDGGETWSKLPSGTEKSIYDISFADERTGWAVGRRGFVIHSQDGGDSWTRQEIPRKPARHIFAIHAIDPQHAWAVGDWGGRYHTVDGGRSWQDRSFLIDSTHSSFKYLTEAELAEYEAGQPVYDDVYMNDVFFLDSERGWMVGEYGIIYRTEDGGQSWDKTKILGDVHFDEIDFPAAEATVPRSKWPMLFAAAEVLIDREYLRIRIQAFMTPAEFARTGDTFLADERGQEIRDFLEGEGISQDRIKLIDPTPFDFEDVDIDAFQRKKLADRPFARIEVRETPFLFDVKFKDRDHGLIAGLGGVLLHSSDGGRTWRYADSDSRQAIFGVGFGAKRLVAAGDKGLSRVSEDGGLHWKLPEAGFPSIFSFMRDVVFGTPERGWIVGEGSLVLRTSDGGLTWEKMSLDLTAQERAAPDHGAGE